MGFKELMKENKKMFDSWMEDEKVKPEQAEYYQKELLKDVQKAIGSDFMIITKEDYQNEIEGALQNG